MPRPSGLRIYLVSPTHKLFKLVVGSSKEDAYPGRAVNRHILNEIAKKEITLAAPCGTTIKQLRTPVCGYCRRLWSQLWTPGGLRSPTLSCDVHSTPHNLLPLAVRYFGPPPSFLPWLPPVPQPNPQRTNQVPKG